MDLSFPTNVREIQCCDICWRRRHNQSFDFGVLSCHRMARFQSNLIGCLPAIESLFSVAISNRSDSDWRFVSSQFSETPAIAAEINGDGNSAQVPIWRVGELFLGGVRRIKLGRFSILRAGWHYDGQVGGDL
jgi:hypothetical protein